MMMVEVVVMMMMMMMMMMMTATTTTATRTRTRMRMRITTTITYGNVDAISPGLVPTTQNYDYNSRKFSKRTIKPRLVHTDTGNP